MGMVVKVDVPKLDLAKVTGDLGVDERGRVQDFLTARVLFHMRHFMPWLSGHMASAQTMQLSPTEIVVNAPQARYLYYGYKMYDPVNGGPFPIFDANGEFQGEFRYRKGAHPVPTSEPLEYTHTQNQDAGPFWDRTLMQRRGAQIAREVTEYARRLNG